SYNAKEGAEIEIRAEKTFVSAGGYKLDKAIEDFGVEISDLVFADVGASTGGFCDALLRRGAKKVYAIDVGKGLLDKTISEDSRVVVMDETNARYLKREDFPEEIDGASVDCSFISIKLILPAIKSFLKSDGLIIALIKPQFECGEKNLSKNGMVLGAEKQRAVVKSVYEYCIENGFSVENITSAPLDKKKNIEYLLLLKLSGESIKLQKLWDIVDDTVKIWRKL
ncbi:MAG: TlyA family RNA methyltransferase, partial [Clostridia bacterium]|nr:TlyA family RNA methyltransferase [Clostridia bacterium]